MDEGNVSAQPISFSSAGTLAQADRFPYDATAKLPATPDNPVRRLRVSKQDKEASTSTASRPFTAAPARVSGFQVNAATVESRSQGPQFPEISRGLHYASFPDQLDGVSQNASDQIVLDVGGTMYKTTKSTLCKYEQTMLEALVRNRRPDNHAVVFIDRDGLRFRDVLNYLRVGRVYMEDVTSLRELHDEAEFFGLSSLQAMCMEKLRDMEARQRNEQAERTRIETENSQQLAATVQKCFDAVVELTLDRPNKSRRVDATPQQHVFRMDEEF